MRNDHDKMIVTDSGICVRRFVDDMTFEDRIILTKDAFVEAYNRWIKEKEE